MQTLIDWDQQLFLFLNGLNAPWADQLMYWITYKWTWTPMYVVLIAISILTFGKKTWGIWLSVILAVIVADQVTSGLMKPFFARPRPCHDPVIGYLVHIVTGCGGKYGFASSHASTSFALATSAFLIMGNQLRWMKWLFVWAVVYAYSRVYVGVHYPGDILVGGVVGYLTGLLSAALYTKYSGESRLIH